MKSKGWILVVVKELIACLLLFIFTLSVVSSQSTITAAGGNSAGTGGSVSYSIGQVIYTTSTETSGSVAQGVQQPYEISVITGLNESIGTNLLFFAYPNPTADNLTLRVENFVQSTFAFSIYDLKGKLLESKKLEGSETVITMKDFPPALYFLKVSQIKGKSGYQEIKLFKIIKH